MGWLSDLTVRALGSRGTIEGLDANDTAARVNILAASFEDSQRERDRLPPPLAGWRYQAGSWMRWSELDADYRVAPVPVSLTQYGRSLGQPREGLTVAMIDGEWQEVSDGAAPLRVQPGEQTLSHVHVDAPADVETPATREAAPSLPPDLPANSPAPPAPVVEEPVVAKPSMQDQLAVWRRRNATSRD